MRRGRTVDIAVSIAAYLIFVVLMQEPLGSEALHEWLGVLLFALLAAHNIYHFGWYRSFFKGKYTASRIALATINIALGVSTICCVASALPISGKVFAFLDLSGASWSRPLHLTATAWAFAFMSLHLGWSLAPLTKKFKKRRLVQLATLALEIALAAYGAYTFVDRAFYEEFFLLTEFKFYDTDKSPVLYFFETFAISLTFVALACYGRKLLQIKGKTNKTLEE